MSIQYEDPTLVGSYDVVGSFPKSFGYGGEEADMEEGFSSEEKPRILLMGLRRSGKSSIQKVRSPEMSWIGLFPGLTQIFNEIIQFQHNLVVLCLLRYNVAA